MNKFSDLYDFIDIAYSNRKYTESVANNLKSTLKIFGRELNEEELASVDMIEDNIEEIFRIVANKNKDKSMGSLNTYKARLLRIISDYKRYGANPAKIQSWPAKEKKSTHLFNQQDKKDKPLSFSNHTPVNSVENCHKIDLALKNGSHAILHIPANVSTQDIKTIKAILDSLS